MKYMGKVVRPERFELPTFWFVARRSIQLSYERIFRLSQSTTFLYLLPLLLVSFWFPPPADSIQLNYERHVRGKILSCLTKCRQNSSFTLFIFAEWLTSNVLIAREQFGRLGGNQRKQ